MALDTYSNLKESIRRWSKRNDKGIDDDIDDFIDIAESEMYANSTAPIRMRTMEARAQSNASTSEKYLALPDQFQYMRSLNIVSEALGNPDITYMAPEHIRNAAFQGQAASGQPRYFTVTTQIEFDRVPDDEYLIEMNYFRKLTPLSATNQTNEILTNHPTVYLYGGLWALWQFYKEEQLSEYYYGKFINSIRGANKADKQGRYGPAPKIRIEGSTP